MRFIRLLLFISLVAAFFSCKKDPNSLTVIQSQSFHVRQIALHFPLTPGMVKDSISKNDDLQNDQAYENELNELSILKDKLIQDPDDKLWQDLKSKWEAFRNTYAGNDQTSFPGKNRQPIHLSEDAAKRWAQLNIDLLKLSEDVRFGDALEGLLYDSPGFAFPDSMLKSIIYTHVFDDIYINIIGSSSVEFAHTTGGTVKLIQETNYPKGTEMILKIETNDVRLVNLYFRIPSWAVNPKVHYGNVKYVAHPGEYCEVSKKWSRGDEITVSLKD